MATGLRLGVDVARLDPKTMEAFDQVLPPLQTWANRQLGGGSWVRLTNDDFSVTAAGTTITKEPLTSVQGGTGTYFKYSRLGNSVTLLFKVLVTPGGATATIDFHIPTFVVYENALTIGLANAAGTLYPLSITMTPVTTAPDGTPALLSISKADGTNFAAAQHSVYGQIVFETVAQDDV